MRSAQDLGGDHVVGPPAVADLAGPVLRVAAWHPVHLVGLDPRLVLAVEEPLVRVPQQLERPVGDEALLDDQEAVPVEGLDLLGGEGLDKGHVGSRPDPPDQCIGGSQPSRRGAPSRRRPPSSPPPRGRAHAAGTCSAPPSAGSRRSCRSGGASSAPCARLVLPALGDREVDLDERVRVAVEHRRGAVLLEQLDVLEPVDVVTRRGGVEVDALDERDVLLVREAVPARNSASIPMIFSGSV